MSLGSGRGKGRGKGESVIPSHIWQSISDTSTGPESHTRSSKEESAASSLSKRHGHSSKTSLRGKTWDRKKRDGKGEEGKSADWSCPMFVVMHGFFVFVLLVYFFLNLC